MYLAARVGEVVPMSEDLRNYGTGWAYEAALGFRLHPNVALELSLGQFSMSHSGIAYPLHPQPPSTSAMHLEETLYVYPLLATIRVVLPVAQVELFALGGFGAYFIHDSVDGSQFPPGEWGAAGDSTVMGFHFGGGVDVHVSTDLSLGAEVEYVLSRATIRLDSLLFTGGLTYRL